MPKKYDTYFYLSTKTLYAVQTTNKGVVTKKLCLDLSPGYVVNGVIVNKNAVTDVLMEAIEQLAPFKEACLSIDTNYIYYKIKPMPKLLPKEVPHVLETEFSSTVSKTRKNIFDFGVLPSKTVAKQQVHALMSSTEEDIIEKFIEFFSTSGIKLSQIRFASYDVLYLLGTSLPEWQNKSFLFCVVDGQLLSVYGITEEGEIYISKTRLLAEGLGKDYAGEIVNTIYTAIRSRRTSNPSEILDTLYVIDTNVPDMSVYENNITSLRATNIITSAGVLIDGIPQGDCNRFFIVMSAVKARKNPAINFLRDVKKSEFGKSLDSGAFFKFITTVIISLIIILAIGLFLFNIQMEIEDLRKKVNNVRRDTIHVEIPAELEVQYELLNIFRNEFLTHNILLESGAVLPASEIIAVQNALGEGLVITNIAFNEEEGWARFSALTNEQLSIAQRVARVRALPYFTGAEYYGHATDSASSFYEYYSYHFDVYVFLTRGVSSDE
ncbi:MAG: hypothetical protein FWE27_03775 [Defluviitaleaceae bacterium]|nr:hypothetical protein [Defluviitaleaceae bacterium]